MNLFLLVSNDESNTHEFSNGVKSWCKNKSRPESKVNVKGQSSACNARHRTFRIQAF